MFNSTNYHLKNDDNTYLDYIVGQTNITTQVDEESANEFDRMMKFFFSPDNPKQLPETTPVLILGNKIDIAPEFTKNHVSIYYSPEDFEINYKIAKISAKTGEGVMEAFQWLVKQMKYL